MGDEFKNMSLLLLFSPPFRYNSGIVPTAALIPCLLLLLLLLLSLSVHDPSAETGRQTEREGRDGAGAGGKAA